MASATVRRLTAAVVVMSTALSACWFGGDDESDPAPATTVPATGSTDEPVVNVEGAIDTNEAAQLGLRLSEGVPAQAAAVDIDVVEGAPIAPADVEAIFDRLPPWDVPDTDRSDFERPPQTLPPPLVVEPIEVPFPPAPTATEPESPATGPLEVVRFQPEGEVDVAPFLSVTFDQPMVPVTTLDQLDDADVPVEISPAIDGRWRWIGTRTLRFEVVPGEFDRLPAATDYRVTVPAGTTSAVGGRLPRDVGWTFSTPPPTVTQFVGDAESTSLTPVFVAVFDQRVDPEGVVATSSLEVEGETVSMRVATDDEVDADRNARTAMSSALAGRAVAFRPVGELPPDSTFRVTIGPDIPSAEGPRTSPRTESFDGRTFGSLELVRTNCESGNGCEPGTPFVFEFSNALDGAEFSADLVSVEPAIPNLSINVFGNVVELQGRTAGRTTYTVRFDGELSDVFGQKLGEPVSVDVEVGSARPALIGLPREWITTDPTAETPHVNVTTINHESIRARVWAVSPVDLDAFRAYQEAQWSDEDAPDPDWPLLFDEVIEIDAGEDEYVETAIDLSSAFAEVGSQVVVRVDPTRDFSPNDDDYWRNRPTISWVQSTTIGIDAFFDHQRLVIWTTDLRTGDPLGGVPVELIGDGRIATTDEEGLAELDLGEEGTLGLWANTGDGTSFLPAQWYEGWTASSRSDEGRWFVFDDRGIYRPGETVRITGWLRNFTSSSEARLELYDDGVSVRYTAWDAQGNEIASGTTDLNALGGFNLAVDIPEGANLGPAWVEFQAVGLGPDQFASTTHSFSIQEFRRPEFEVTADTETPGPFYVAEPATVRVDAEYFSGGPLPDADVEWLVSRRDTTYRPPNWDEYTFGLWTPWWAYGGDVAVERSADVAFEPCFDCGPGFATEFEQFTGRTDAAGSHYLQIDFDGREVDLPTAVTAEATVFDVNRQAWASRTDLLVHAAEYYVGLRSDRAFVARGHTDPHRRRRHRRGRRHRARTRRHGHRGSCRVGARRRRMGRTDRGRTHLFRHVDRRRLRRIDAMRVRGRRRRHLPHHGDGHRRRRSHEPNRDDAVGQRRRGAADPQRRAGLGHDRSRPRRVRGRRHGRAPGAGTVLTRPWNRHRDARRHRVDRGVRGRGRQRGRRDPDRGRVGPQRRRAGRHGRERRADRRRRQPPARPATAPCLRHRTHRPADPAARPFARGRRHTGRRGRRARRRHVGHGGRGRRRRGPGERGRRGDRGHRRGGVVVDGLRTRRPARRVLRRHLVEPQQRVHALEHPPRASRPGHRRRR